MHKLFSQVRPDTPGALFRLYMATVLLQFGILSFMNVNLGTDPGITQRLQDLVLAPNYWWGTFSLFGAASLALRRAFAGWKLGAAVGELAAVATFMSLSYDYLTSKPPLYAGGVLAGTAAAFLIGGLLSDKRGTA